MARYKDIQGQRFGFLVVLQDSGDRTPEGGMKWMCRCICGKFPIVSSKCLLKGETKSCGCFRKKLDLLQRSDTRLGDLKHDFTLKYGHTDPRQLTDKKYSHNTSGYRNIYIIKNKYSNKYRVQLTFQNHKIYGGQYPTLAEALEVREMMYTEIWGPAVAQYERDQALLKKDA